MFGSEKLVWSANDAYELPTDPNRPSMPCVCEVEFHKRTDPAAIRQKSKADQKELMERSAEAEASSSSTVAAPGQPTVVLVFSSVEYSQEELRAKLPRYSYSEDRVRQQLSQLNSAIESKLARWANRA